LVPTDNTVGKSFSTTEMLAVFTQTVCSCKSGEANEKRADGFSVGRWSLV